VPRPFAGRAAPGSTNASQPSEVGSQASRQASCPCFRGLVGREAAARVAPVDAWQIKTSRAGAKDKRMPVLKRPKFPKDGDDEGICDPL
jgi:hypothetical protein